MNLNFVLHIISKLIQIVNEPIGSTSGDDFIPIDCNAMNRLLGPGKCRTKLSLRPLPHVHRLVQRSAHEIGVPNRGEGKDFALVTL